MTSPSSGQRRWDSSRPVPWERLLKEWVIVAAVGTVVIYFLLNERTIANVVYAIAWSLPMYLGVGYVMAKLGIQRESLADRRAAAAAKRDESSGESGGTKAGASRAKKPPPTKRTNANNRQGKSRSRR